MRRYARWALYVLVAIALVLAVYFLEDDLVSPLWAVAIGALIALSAWDGWRLGGSEAPAAARGGLAGVVIAIVVIAVEALGFWLYRSAGERALAAGWRAHRAGECRAAVGHYNDVTTLHQVTFTDVVSSARTRTAECRQLLAARTARQDERFPTAVSEYRSFLQSYPQSVLVSQARDELTSTERAWDRSYQRGLTVAGRTIKDSVERLRRLGAVPRASAWFDRAQAEFARAEKALEEVPPPPSVEDAHDDLDAALDGLAARLPTMVSAVRARTLCAAPAILAELGGGDDGRALRASERSLRRAGFNIDLSMLWGAPQLDRRLPNGRFLVPGNRSGANSVTIENEGRLDAVVVFTLGSKRPWMSVYSRGGEDHTISAIPDGDYRVFFTFGEDWDARYQTFTRVCEFFSLGERAMLSSDASRYTVATLTLQSKEPVKGPRSVRIAPDAFPNAPRK